MSDQQNKVRKKICHCQNCGQPGHVSRNCVQPVTSFGVILFDRKPILQLERQDDGSTHAQDVDETYSERFQIRYLLVRRRDSMSYVELLRGKYNPQDIRFIYQMLTEMTIDEREKLRTKSFDSMWRDLWSVTRGFGNAGSAEYMAAAAKFFHLKNGSTLHDGCHMNLQSALKATKSLFSSPEWGFAKGRRSRREKDMQCAKREFGEETGLREHDYNIISQLGTVEESFRGSNRVNYRHIYFVGNSKTDKSAICLDPHNSEQVAEIGDIGWFTCDEALRMFRPYDIEKKALMIKLNDVLCRVQFPEEET